MSDRRNIGDILEAVARHVFRHRGTGDEAVLAADRIEGPGNDAWWAISLDCAPGSPPAQAGLRATVWCGTPTLARRAFAERQRALRAAGYERADLGGGRPGGGSPASVVWPSRRSGMDGGRESLGLPTTVEISRRCSVWASQNAQA